MAVEGAPSNAELQREVARLERELAEARRQGAEAHAREAATADVLRVIASSPTDLQTVLNTLVANAARLCEASDALIYRVDGSMLRLEAICGSLPPPPPEGVLARGRVLPVARGSVVGRVVVDRQTVHIHDLAAEPASAFPEANALHRQLGHRTVLATPLLREGVPIGAILVRRTEVRPFTDKQIQILKTFADQAVIAIENARLFQEFQDRNRELPEALEQQTATSEILRVIASSPTDLQGVLQTIIDTAARLCETPSAALLQLRERDGQLAPRAIAGPVPLVFEKERGERESDTSDFESALGSVVAPTSAPGRVYLEGRTIHVHDMASAVKSEYPDSIELQARLDLRGVVFVPLLRDGTAIGVLSMQRYEVRPFTQQQIRLLETFADQAVIAIENTRLFQELQDRVEELQALGEVGQAVSSTLDLQEVLSTVVTYADRLSGTDGGALYEFDEEAREFRLRAARQFDATVLEAFRVAPVRLGEGAIGQAALVREPVQIPDIAEGGAYEGRLRGAMLAAGYRAVLAVPLLREDRILGGLVVVRKTPGAFPPNVVELVKTFASQSALAVQNARLFREIEEKSLQLELVSKHKSEFLTNMSHELRTPLNAIIGFSEVLLERLFGDVNGKQEEYLRDILTSGQHLLSLINDILDLSKVEAGRMDLEVGTFSLREALENGLTMLKERASRHRIALGLEIAPDLDEIEADERKVKQVLFNLLSNAVKFTPDGGRVDVSARHADGEVEIAVRDTGVGIAPDDLPHVFDEFRQVGQGEAKHEGTGLGLPLAKRFVELHGGRMWVDSQPGRGSTFTFMLRQPVVRHESGPTQ